MPACQRQRNEEHGQQDINSSEARTINDQEEDGNDDDEDDENTLLITSGQDGQQ